MRILFLLWLLLLPASRAGDGPGLLIRQWQSEDGLPGNVVRSIVQDTHGYLWIATAEGIARFDGTEFEPIEPEGELRKIRFAFRRLFTSPGGDVWAATFQGGLFRIRDGVLLRVLEDTPRPRPPLVQQLLSDHQGVIHFKRGDEYWAIRGDRAEPLQAVPDEVVSLFAADAASQTLQGRAVEPGDEPRLRTRDGRFWATDENGKLAIHRDDGPVQPVTLPGSGEPYTPTEMLEDREGNVWIATPTNGLIRVGFSRVEVLDVDDGLAERSSVALLQDRHGTWWIAGRRGGITRWTPDFSEHLPLVPSGSQRPGAAIFEDKDGRIWIASRGGSVFLRTDEGFVAQFQKTQMPSKVRAIRQDPSGRIWFGGELGLTSYDGTEVTEHEIGGSGTDITVLETGPNGVIYAGTSDGRVFAGSTGGFHPLGEAPNLRHRWISGILARAEDEIWVTTLGGGLFHWNGRKWRQFGDADGIPENRLTAILEDGRGHFWIGSLGGILRVSRAELLARTESPEFPLHWLRLDRSDGLPSRECIGGYQPAAWRADDGQLWFPTGTGIVRVRPELVEINQVPPPVFIRGVRANGHLYGAGERVETGPGRSRLEFRFVGLSHSAPEKVTYRARLTGLDDSWRELGSQRVASFEAVPPGRYQFEVIAVNGDGIWSEAPAKMSVIVRPHFWETSWFLASSIVATLLFAIGTGWGIARVRMKRRIQKLKLKHAREAERARIARDLHDELGASLTEISILSALAAEAEEECGMRPALAQLSGKAKEVIGTLDEIVWAVNPREDSLRSLIDYLAAFAREFLGTARIALRTDIPRTIPELPLDTAVRHGVFLAAREVLNNLVKHSGASEARITIRIESGKLVIRIQDNGKGLPTEWQSKGYGVGNLRQRMASCGGECEIASISGSGVTVTLTLPLLAQSSAAS